MAISLDLSGKCALVTGGTRGIGRAISTKLAAAGARVAMMYRADEESANAAVVELQAAGPAQHFAVKADLADHAQCAASARKILDRLGSLDIAVLNAGIVRPHAPFNDLTFDQWLEPIDVNLNGHVAVLQAISSGLRRGASVIFISSGAGHDPIENLSAYGTSKAALNHLASVLAQEWGPRGIRVNTVSPGGTAKDPIDYEHLTAHQKDSIAATALRRIGTAEDVAGAVLFFSCEESSFVTGQWLRVNGGRV